MIARATIGFGCPNATDPHHFAVEIPAGRSGFVVIVEQYGVRAGIGGLPEAAARCRLPRAVWAAIAEEVKRDFNERLAAKKLPTSRWTVGVNKVERLLGKELLVLAWAVERADPALIPNAVRNWIGLKPEERWWLYTMTAAASGGSGDGDIGWRKALRFALTENPADEEQLTARKTRALGMAEDPSPFAGPMLPLFERVKEP
ncbi:conserved hypothetical protein [uncultured Defluviicoccus sp.]|uniref:DUF3780 domain-containing protein n=1 Tax=metagenome TaxID=256318 RepID=A0A380T9Y6_9ZZZZ|nr:conserved hypothetical protein [uncultured Defluviicoccus sp.]